ncbi:MAG: PEGA domain-containing protein [Candidatus Microgenomates bacterium]|jgi:hypothetical protein
MKTVNIILISIVSLASLVAAALFLIGYFKPKPGGILVDTSPPASVYINGNLVGTTPYQGFYKAGQITLKLVPNATNTTLTPYETQITLVSEIQTVVRREFGSSEDASSGDVISFETQAGTTAGMVVVSTPDNAQVSVDGVTQGFAPYETSTISPAQHQITVKAPGYADRVMSIKTLVGYRLTVFAKLAKGVSSDESSLSNPSPSPTPEPYVQIGNTPTGFLRVRTLPGAAGKEIGEAKPGSVYPYIDIDAATGWLEIQYEASSSAVPGGVTGWVSGQFAQKIPQPLISTPSATPALIP